MKDESSPHSNSQEGANITQIDTFRYRVRHKRSDNVKDDLIEEFKNLKENEFGFEFKKQVLRHFQLHLNHLRSLSL